MAKFYKMLIVPAGAADGDKTNCKTYVSTRQGSAPAGWRCIAVLGYFEKTGRVKED